MSNPTSSIQEGHTLCLLVGWPIIPSHKSSEVIVKIRTLIFILLLAGALPFALSGCGDSEGPAEQAGENIDEAAEETDEATENMMDQTEESAEEMGESMDEAAEETGESMENAMDEAQNEADEMGDNIED